MPAEVSVTPEQARKINAAAAKIRIVWWGDLIRPSDHNAYVEWLNAVHEAFNIPDFDQYLSKLRYVDKGDIITAEDFNNVADALKYAIPYLIEVHDVIFSESEYYLVYREDALNALAELHKVQPKEAVSHKDWNKRAVATLKIHAVVVKEFMEYEIPVSIDLIYSLSDVYIQHEAIISTLHDTSAEYVHAAISMKTDFDSFIDYVEKSLAVQSVSDAVIESVDLSAIIELANELTISTLDLSAIIELIGDLTIDTVTKLGIISAEYDFPPSLSSISEISLNYDFFGYIDVLATVSLSLSQWIDTLSKSLSIELQNEQSITEEYFELPIRISEFSTFTEVVSKTITELKTQHDTTDEYVSFTATITVKGDAALAIGGEGFVNLTFDIPTDIVEFVTSAISATFDLNTNVFERVNQIGLSSELAIDVKDLIPQITTNFDTHFSTEDLSPLVNASFDKTLETFDLNVNELVASIEQFIETFDVSQVISTEIDSNLNTRDVSQTILTTIEKSVAALSSPTCNIYLSSEFELAYWFDLAWKYRREIKITNDASEVWNYQLMIVLDPTSFDYAKANPDGSDIRFTDTDGVTPLNYFIERWEQNGRSVIWVLIPYLPIGEKRIWMYYGNPNATSESNPYAVFDWYVKLDNESVLDLLSVYFGGGMDNAKVIKS